MISPAQPLTSDRVFVFVHIPKTAGVTLSHIIRRHFRSSEIFQPPGSVSYKTRSYYERLAPEERARYRAIVGHVEYGIHDLTPRPPFYVTLLREPIDLIVSLYQYVLQEPTHRFHPEVKTRRMNLLEFVESRYTTYADNVQTRYLCDEPDAIATVPVGGCTPQMLDQAIENLTHRFGVFGLTDRFDEMVLLLGRALGWEKLYYGAANVTRRRPRREAIPEREREAIARINRFDVQLYQAARVLFEQRVQEQGEAFQSARSEFNRRNRRWGPIWGTLDRGLDWTVAKFHNRSAFEDRFQTAQL